MRHGVTGAAVEVRLLAGVEVWSGGRPLDAGGPRQRSVLAVLASEANRLLPMETIVDRVWDSTPPARARHTVQAYVTRLRKLVGADRLIWRSGAYQLTGGPETIDVLRAGDLAARARHPTAGPEVRVGLLREALALWRGVPLAGLPGEWAARTRRQWSQQRLDTALAWAEVELRRGGPAVVVPQLEALVAEHRLSEPLTGALMRALVADGRPGEALDRYLALRGRLADQLGCDPGPTLRRLYLTVLRGTWEQPQACVCGAATG